MGEYPRDIPGIPQKLLRRVKQENNDEIM